MTAAKEIEELGPNRVVSAEFVAGATRAEQLPPPALAEIAFAGRSNVGKSSLMNAMMQRRNLVRTSRTPGCTRQINVFGCTTGDGLALHLVDLPGYGYAKLSKAEKSTWGLMLEGYLRTRITLRAVVLLTDVAARAGGGRHRAPRVHPGDARSCRGDAVPGGGHAHRGRDQARQALNQRKPALIAFKKATGVTPVGFSAVTGDGRGELWERIRRAVQVGP